MCPIVISVAHTYKNTMISVANLNCGPNFKFYTPAGYMIQQRPTDMIENHVRSDVTSLKSYSKVRIVREPRNNELRPLLRGRHGSSIDPVHSRLFPRLFPQDIDLEK